MWVVSVKRGLNENLFGPFANLEKAKEYAKACLDGSFGEISVQPLNPVPDPLIDDPNQSTIYDHIDEISDANMPIEPQP